MKSSTLHACSDWTMMAARICWARQCRVPFDPPAGMAASSHPNADYPVRQYILQSNTQAISCRTGRLSWIVVAIWIGRHDACRSRWIARNRNCIVWINTDWRGRLWGRQWSITRSRKEWVERARFPRSKMTHSKFITLPLLNLSDDRAPT